VRRLESPAEAHLGSRDERGNFLSSICVRRLRVATSKKALVVLGLILVLGACGSNESTSDPAEAAPRETAGDSTTDSSDGAPVEPIDFSGVRLRVGVVGANGPVREEVYRRSGAFDDAPYEIEWIDFDGAASLIEALNARAIDVGVNIQSPVVVLSGGNAATPWTAETAPMFVVGAATPINDRGMNISVHTDSGIESMEDLAGRKVTYPPGTMFHYFYALVAKQAGLVPGEVEEVQMPAGEGRAAFTSGAVDALVSGPRTTQPLYDSGDARLLVSSLGIVTPYRLHLVRAGVLDDRARAAALGDLLERVDVAEAWSAVHVDEVASIYESAASMSESEAREAAVTAPMGRIPLDEIVRGALLDQMALFLENGVIQSEVDLDALIDDRYEEVAAR
jgi:sulfonate transport system substrate-binding protein